MSVHILSLKITLQHRLRRIKIRSGAVLAKRGRRRGEKAGRGMAGAGRLQTPRGEKGGVFCKGWELKIKKAEGEKGEANPHGEGSDAGGAGCPAHGCLSVCPLEGSRGRAGDASAGCMMESIRNFLQLRNTPNTRTRERAEESRVPGGNEAGGECGELEITRGESSEGRGQRAGGNLLLWSFFHLFPFIFWLLFLKEVPCGAACAHRPLCPLPARAGALAYSGALVYSGALAYLGLWCILEVLCLSPGRLARRWGTRGSVGWGVPQSPCFPHGAGSSPENGHIPAGRCPGSAGPFGGTRRGSRCPRSCGSASHTCDEFARRLFGRAPASPWARLG